MTDMEHLKIAFERNVQTLTLRPSRGQKSYRTKVRVHHGLTCEIEDGPWRLTADLAHTGGAMRQARRLGPWDARHWGAVWRCPMCCGPPSSASP